MKSLSHRQFICVGIVLLACISGLVIHLRNARAGGTPSVDVTAVSAVDFAALIPSADVRESKFAIVDAAAARDSIVVLLAPANKVLDYCLVLRTSVLGQYLSSWRAPRNLAPVIGYDRAGNVVLVRRQQGNTEILVYGESGEIKSSGIVAEPISQLIDTAAGMIGISSGGLTLLFGDPLASTRRFPVRLPPSLAAALPGTRIAVVEKADARLHVVELDSSSESSVLLSAPEIIRSALPPPPSGSGEGKVVTNAVYSLASNANGMLFVALTSHPLASGSAVLEVTPEGQVQRCLRFLLPKAADLKTQFNPEGYIFPGKLLVSGDMAVWLDRGQARAAAYRLPSH